MKTITAAAFVAAASVSIIVICIVWAISALVAAL